MMSSETLIFNTFRSILTIVRVENAYSFDIGIMEKSKLYRGMTDFWIIIIYPYISFNIIEFKNIDISIRNLFDFYFTYYWKKKLFLDEIALKNI